MIRPRSRLGRFLPWPLVGVVTLLAALILLTPALLSTQTSKPSAGTILTQAELLVDRGPTVNSTNLYIEGLGVVRYDYLHMGLSSPYNWSANSPVSSLRWGNWTNLSGVLALARLNLSEPIAVNVSAEYVDPTGIGVVYVGIFAFTEQGGVFLTRVMTSGIAGAPPTLVGNLPLTFLLATLSVGPVA